MSNERDIFESENKIRNMNYLFDEDPAGEGESLDPFEEAVRNNLYQKEIGADKVFEEEPVMGNSYEEYSVTEEREVPRTRAEGTEQRRPAARRSQGQVRSSSGERRRVASQTQSGERRRVSSQASSGERKRPASQTPSGERKRPAGQAPSGERRRPASQAPSGERRRMASQAPSGERRRVASQAPSGERRRTVSQAPSGERQRPADRQVRGGKKRKSGFKKFILIYSAILLLILIAGMIIFSSFLKSLEKNQPSHIAAEVAENFTEGKVSSFLEKNENALNSFGDTAPLIQACADNLKGKEAASYIENKDYRADAPSYNLTTGGETVCKLTLEKDGKAGFGLDKWKIASLDVGDYIDTGSFEFDSPEGAVITINGEELSDKYKTNDEPTTPEVLLQAANYVNLPKYNTYKVAGIPGDPQISAKDASGSDLAVSEAGNKYVVGTETDQAFIDSVSPLVENALEAWGKHFINMGGNLRAYMLEGSEWYGYIFGSEDMDPIMTSFYEYESIANYEFTEKSASNYIKYSDDCFTVDVKYKMKIDFTTDRLSDNNQQLDATWTIITQNGGEDWYIIDCIYK